MQKIFLKSILSLSLLCLFFSSVGSVIHLVRADFNLIDTLREDYAPNNLPREDDLEQSSGNSNGTSDIYVVGGITSFVSRVINLILYIAGTIAVIAIIVGGAQYVFSFGSEEAENAKKNIMWSIIGLVAVMLSYVLVQNIVRIIVTNS